LLRAGVLLATFKTPAMTKTKTNAEDDDDDDDKYASLCHGIYKHLTKK